MPRVELRERPQAPLDPAVFRGIFSGFPSGVTVVTALDENGHPVGLTVSAVMSVSLDPPLLAACLQNAKYTLEVIRESGSFAVNFLSSGQSAISNSFAVADKDKFATVGWRSGDAVGVPVLNDVRAHAECEVFSVVEAGDHTLIIGRILAGSATPGAPLTYCGRQYADLVYRQAS